MKYKIKFIYFDIGDVIYRWIGGLQKLSTLSHIPEETLSQLMQKNDSDRCRGIGTMKEYWFELAKQFKIKRSLIHDFHDFWTDHYVSIQETHQIIHRLSNKYQLGLLTNISKGLYKIALQKKHIPHVRYHAVVQSCDIGYIKPENEIFEFAEKKAGVNPNSILFVDDVEVNIKTASKRGWQTVLFNTHQPSASIMQIQKLL